MSYVGKAQLQVYVRKSCSGHREAVTETEKKSSMST